LHSLAAVIVGDLPAVNSPKIFNFTPLLPGLPKMLGGTLQSSISICCLKLLKKPLAEKYMVLHFEINKVTYFEMEKVGLPFLFCWPDWKFGSVRRIKYETFLVQIFSSCWQPVKRRLRGRKIEKIKVRFHEEDPT
jgi:hypothetical protein